MLYSKSILELHHGHTIELMKSFFSALLWTHNRLHAAPESNVTI